MTAQRFFMTGSAGGIGRHLTDLLIQGGHYVFATDLDLESLDEHARRRGWPTDRVHWRQLDVRNPDDWEATFAQAVAAFDHIDVSMNVPGVMRVNWIAETPGEDVHLQLDTNVKGVVWGTRVAARHMTARRSGHIVNFSSLAGAAPVPGMSVYCASKYAVRGFSVSVARELRRHGVYVTAVCPDAVDTRLLDIPHIHDEEAALVFSGPRVLSVEEVGRVILKHVLRRKPEICCIPRYRGWQARFAEAFPSLMRIITPWIVKQGRTRQARRAKQISWRAGKPVSSAAGSPGGTEPLHPSACLEASGSVMSPETAEPRESPAEIPVRNPRTGEVLYSVPEPASETIAQIYENARRAFSALRELSVRKRVSEIGRLREYILENKERIVARIVEETGKCRTDAMMLDIFPVLDIIRYYEKHAVRILADQKVRTPFLLLGKKSKIYYEPLGPILVIAPWNYPFNLSMIPAISAFLAGNSVILKPSERTPLRGVVEEMVERSGFMPNAIQVAYAGPQTAGRLIDAKPAKVFFTGSVEVGKKVMARAARHLIPVELELGGKDAMIVFDDVNVERTVAGALWGGMVNSGQTCFAAERIYVQSGLSEEFVRVLKEKAERLRTLQSLPAVPDTGDLDVGCMTAEFQVKKVEEQLADAVNKGARVVLGGKRMENSLVFPPTIVVDVDDSMKIQSDETFGPVVTVTMFDTEDEAIRLANHSRYGLGASVWSGDRKRAERVARQLIVGNVSINNVMAFAANPALPYGGIKESGFGRYKGSLGLHTFSNIKSVVIDRQGLRAEANWYPYSKEKYRLMTNMIDAFFQGSPFKRIHCMPLVMKLQRLVRSTKV